MKIKDIKCKCGHEDLFFINQKKQTGIYCSYCGKFVKWANKDELNLTIKYNVCDGCIYDKAGTISSYPCTHCTRFYTDKYTAESGDNQ